MFKDRILNRKLSWIVGEAGQRLGRRVAQPVRIGVVFRCRPLQQTEDFFLSQLLVSC